MEKITVDIRRDAKAKDLPLPKYATEGASGMDLQAAVEKELRVSPGEVVLVPTGLYISLPAGYEAQIRPRSGLALKHGITIVNTPGTIDADYRGEIGIILGNIGREDFVVTRGMRIAQMVIQKVTRAELVETDSLDDTPRGNGGFGHTGHT